MYLSFFKLREFPFALSSDERFFFESAVHTEALANMIYTVQQRKGMVLVTGEVGAGKTFVGNVMAGRLGPGCTTLVIQSPPQSGKQLLRTLAARLGVAAPGNLDKMALSEELQDQLNRVHNRGRLIALILDECQDLTPASLEELRLLWNWEADGQRLIQIVLIGQPELREKLMEAKWEPLRQRIVLSYHLGPLRRKTRPSMSSTAYELPLRGLHGSVHAGGVGRHPCGDERRSTARQRPGGRRACRGLRQSRPRDRPLNRGRGDSRHDVLGTAAPSQPAPPSPIGSACTTS